MMRRFLSGALALLLAAALVLPGRAAASAEIVRAFVYDGALYTYVAIEGAEAPITKAEARIGTRTFPAAGRLETVRQAGSPVTWMLLVDNSNSMPAFRQEAEAFVRSLAETGGEHTRFFLASFGDEFTVVREDVPAGELAAELAAIPMDEKVTRLHTAIGAALDYLEALPRERNELRCAVVLSDAVQYDPAGGIPYEELLERVGRSDVMLYSAGFGADGEALERLGRLAEASGGLHQVVGEESAQAAAAAFRARGFHFLGGRTSGYWGPYVWRDEEVKRYAVELPDGEREYAVKFLDGFVMKSWLDYISFGEAGTGGWSDGDGLICCVRDAYDLDAESFRVSLLKHEAQHAADLETYQGMSSEDLEYRAKLVELIYSRERNLLERFAGEADASRAGNGHGIAACRLLEGIERLLRVPREAFASLPVEDVQAAARTLFAESTREAGKKYNKATP